ncbi:hypothetical protein JAAARDRAFT_237452 [Jaapia argillacea MUCL 33604]|uniref:Uncharacterized protein n=1 Tax=Jaapia argillacea MUCL 33604 TaxID=933084 RepID=A0A067QQ44_9AGAM|nr:hypothetical protein JAAARDRAFT_237452 [Jaapia argillacea MUCL 33604]
MEDLQPNERRHARKGNAVVPSIRNTQKKRGYGSFPRGIRLRPHPPRWALSERMEGPSSTPWHSRSGGGDEDSNSPTAGRPSTSGYQTDIESHLPFTFPSSSRPNPDSGWNLSATRINNPTAQSSKADRIYRSYHRDGPLRDGLSTNRNTLSRSASEWQIIDSGLSGLSCVAAFPQTSSTIGELNEVPPASLSALNNRPQTASIKGKERELQCFSGSSFAGSEVNGPAMGTFSGVNSLKPKHPTFRFRSGTLTIKPYAIPTERNRHSPLNIPVSSTPFLVGPYQSARPAESDPHVPLPTGDPPFSHRPTDPPSAQKATEISPLPSPSLPNDESVVEATSVDYRAVSIDCTIRLPKESKDKPRRLLYVPADGNLYNISIHGYIDEIEVSSKYVSLYLFPEVMQ